MNPLTTTFLIAFDAELKTAQQPSFLNFLNTHAICTVPQAKQLLQDVFNPKGKNDAILKVSAHFLNANYDANQTFTIDLTTGTTQLLKPASKQIVQNGNFLGKNATNQAQKQCTAKQIFTPTTFRKYLCDSFFLCKVSDQNILLYDQLTKLNRDAFVSLQPSDKTGKNFVLDTTIDAAVWASLCQSFLTYELKHWLYRDIFRFLSEQLECKLNTNKWLFLTTMAYSLLINANLHHKLDTFLGFIKRHKHQLLSKYRLVHGDKIVQMLPFIQKYYIPYLRRNTNNLYIHSLINGLEQSINPHTNRQYRQCFDLTKPFGNAFVAANKCLILHYQDKK
ncbi:hypothetical protein [Mycoplasmopsis columbinasalis]|uniref:Uncharacterized protein n=1 Tax=Mycoplasmopsis columbinasalis TaxID=114880 RepID=A0A449B9P6_9BACT|nr:hypothetical protein [Mycoplasmopsis columbinasalis]VEU77902.1 Uncharacterised protein [Mycoplasmopsis columbinasalis]